MPFLDNDLVDFAMRCPVALKLNNLSDVIRINENEPGDKQGKYFMKTNDGKQILRNMMRSYVPETICDGIKQGFSAPDASWFKGDSIEYVKRQLMGDTPRLYQYLDRHAAHGLIEEHLAGTENRRLFIWSLLNVEQWLASNHV